MKLLVVEDDLTLSTVICFELDCNDYLTVAAYNCKKAYQLIQSDHFDLAILDVNLPDGNGFDLGAEDYVTKPFNMKILLRHIEVAVRRNHSLEQQTMNCWSDGFEFFVHMTKANLLLLCRFAPVLHVLTF